MEVKIADVIKHFLGKTVLEIRRLTLQTKEDFFILNDTLVFTLECDLEYQMLISQNKVKWITTSNKKYQVDFELEISDSIGTVKIDFDIFPIVVGGIEEIFAEDGPDKFMVGLVFMDDSLIPKLSILTETDEALLVNSNYFLEHRQQMLLDYHTLCNSLHTVG